MDCSMPGFPVLHYLPELAQTHVHWVSDAIQPPHPLSPPSPPVFNLSQHQGFFPVISSHQVVKVLELQFQHKSFQWIFRIVSLRIDGFDLLVVQGTLKKLLHHHNSKTSVLQSSAFFIYWVLTACQELFKALQFSSVTQSCQLFVTPWTAAHQASLSITNSQSLLKFMSIESVMPSNHLILCCPLLLPPSVFPNIRVFSNESVLCIRWPKYWFQHQCFQWIFRTDFL